MACPAARRISPPDTISPDNEPLISPTPLELPAVRLIDPPCAPSSSSLAAVPSPAIMLTLPPEPDLHPESPAVIPTLPALPEVAIPVDKYILPVSPATPPVVPVFRWISPELRLAAVATPVLNITTPESPEFPAAAVSIPIEPLVCREDVPVNKVISPPSF